MSEVEEKTQAQSEYESAREELKAVRRELEDLLALAITFAEEASPGITAKLEALTVKEERLRAAAIYKAVGANTL